MKAAKFDRKTITISSDDGRNMCKANGSGLKIDGYLKLSKIDEEDEDEKILPDVKKGNIEGSKSLPFKELIDQKTNKFLDKRILKEKFDLAEINSNETVMRCGSSVSAATLALAYSLINDDYMI